MTPQQGAAFCVFVGQFTDALHHERTATPALLAGQIGTTKIRLASYRLRHAGRLVRQPDVLILLSIRLRPTPTLRVINNSSSALCRLASA